MTYMSTRRRDVVCSECRRERSKDLLRTHGTNARVRARDSLRRGVVAYHFLLSIYSLPSPCH
jgi:hypothetical protein